MKENENEKNIDNLTPVREFFREHCATLSDACAIGAVDDIDTHKMCFNCKHFKQRNLVSCSGFCQEAARQGVRDDNNELPTIHHKMVCDLFVQKHKEYLEGDFRRDV